MDREWLKRTQITLGIFVVIALIRVGFIFYDRMHEPEAHKEQPTSSYKVTLDDYVTPHKLFPWDVKSAHDQLAGKTAWVKVGNQVPYYAYRASTRSVDATKRAGLLGPLEKVEITDVIAQSIRGQKQVMAIFAKPDVPDEYAVSIGTINDGIYNFLLNEIFFFDDPHGLYNHWPADVWNAIDHHEAKPGMNELQVSFALGSDIRATPGEYGNRTVQYMNGDKMTTVTFSENRATSIQAGQQ
jgi:hypothetical protein